MSYEESEQFCLRLAENYEVLSFQSRARGEEKDFRSIEAMRIASIYNDRESNKEEFVQLICNACIPFSPVAHAPVIVIAGSRKLEKSQRCEAETIVTLLVEKAQQQDLLLMCGDSTDVDQMVMTIAPSDSVLTIVGSGNKIKHDGGLFKHAVKRLAVDAGKRDEWMLYRANYAVFIYSRKYGAPGARIAKAFGVSHKIYFI